MPGFPKSFLLLLPAFLGLVCFIPSKSSASVPKPAGVVTQVAGHATLHRIGLAEPLPVKFKDRVFLQDKIHTQEKTFVRVLLGGKALVTVRELSVLTITEDVDHATIDIQSGIVGLSVARKRMKPGEYIEIRTPHAIAAVRGTTVLTQVTSLTNMAVLEGFIDIAGIATPTQTIQLTQLTALKATDQGLGQAGSLSAGEIKILQQHLQPDQNVAPEISPLSDVVANTQSEQAAALAEALAPQPQRKESQSQASKPESEESESSESEESEESEEDSELQAEESESGESSGGSSTTALVLSTQDLEIDLNVPPSRIFNGSRTFNTVTFSGGTTQGAGTLTVDGATTVTGGTNTVENPYHSKGQVNVNGGSINFKGGGTHEGGFTTSAGTTLEFGGGTHNIFNDVTGSGTVKVSAGAVNINNGTYNITGNSTSVTGGILSFNAASTLTSLGPLSVSGGLINFLSAEAVSLSSFDFSGGTISGTDTVTANGPTTVTGSGTKIIEVPFNNADTLTLESGTLRLLGNGSHTGNFDTKSGTTLEFGNGTQNLNGIDVSGEGEVNLAGGTFNTSGATTISNPFNNQGTVNVNEGSLTLQGEGAHTGDFSTAAGTTLEFGGGTHDLIGDVTGPGTVEVSAGAVNVNGGTYNVTGNSTAVSGGTLTFNAGATLTSLGPVSISNGGLMRLFANATHTNDFSILTGSTLEFGGGTHDLSGIDFLGLGTVNLTGGTFNTTGTTTMNNPFNNQGTVNVNEGSLTLQGDGTHTGSFTTADNTTLEFSGGTHDLTGDVTGPGTVEVSAGAVNVNGGTYSVTGNSTTVSGGTLTFNAGATLTSLGPVSISNGGLLRLFTGAIHTNTFNIGTGSTLEFGGGINEVAGSSLSGPGTVRVTGGELKTPGKLFELSADLQTENILFQQTGGFTNIGSAGNTGSDALQVGTHSLDAFGNLNPLFDISGGELTTDGVSGDLIQTLPGGGTVTAGGSILEISGTGSDAGKVTLKGTGSSILDVGGGDGNNVSLGNTAVVVREEATLDTAGTMNDNSNDVAVVSNQSELSVRGSVLAVSDSAAVEVERSVGRLDNGKLTTTNGGHVLEATGGTTTMGNSVLDMAGSTSKANISGSVIHATGGQINGPSGSNVVNVDAGTLTTGSGIIHAEGDDRIVLATGTADAIVDITSPDGTHDLGTAAFNLTGEDPQGGPLDTPLTKKDGGNNDVAVDQTLLRTSGATVSAKKLLVVDQALLDATATLFQILAGSDVTVDPGVGSGALDVSNMAIASSTMPLLSLDNSNMEITTGNLLTLAAMTNVTIGTAITSANLLDLNNSTISILNGLLADVSGTLTVHGLLASLNGTSSITVTNNIAPTHTIGGYPVHIANGGTITTGNGSTNLFVNTTDISVTAGGSLLRADGGTIHVEGEVMP
ncbi:FecR domain-containing protein [Candidatus Nitronereus thalassa]|uniref:FecR domain-containing protein n=1 Tax=Candidatus Nitronereus thalassa TaxID=3020898 RepID=A0ABU3K9J1_9BACT|nr:FecR domain-containing protein [Candidatus Nitronereus thalassa]MDT7042999.1 FecR domain-containing protein [Candidatus Nitronereus thalassa]